MCVRVTDALNTAESAFIPWAGEKFLGFSTDFRIYVLLMREGLNITWGHEKAGLENISVLKTGSISKNHLWR